MMGVMGRWVKLPGLGFYLLMKGKLLYLDIGLNELELLLLTLTQPIYVYPQLPLSLLGGMLFFKRLNIIIAI